MNEQVWLLYGTGILKSELFALASPPKPELIGIYGDLQNLLDDNSLFDDDEISDGCIIAGISEAVEKGDGLILALGAHSTKLNELLLPPEDFFGGMFVCACYCFCKARGEI